MSDKFYVVSKKGTKLFYENGKRIPAADAEGRNFRERTSSCKEGKEKSPFSGRCVKPCPDDKPFVPPVVAASLSEPVHLRVRLSLVAVPPLARKVRNALFTPTSV